MSEGWGEVSSETVGSAVLRRYIGRRLETLRKRAGLTQEQAAEELQKGRTTIARWEEGHENVRFRDVDVKALLSIYGAGDDDLKVLLALTAETRNGRRKSWWHDYTETALPTWFGLYVTLEDSSETIRQYESELIPGLLRTPTYAEEVARVPPGYVAEEEIARRVQVRVERQSLLTRPRAPHVQVILNQAVLHRPVGGNHAMAQQLDHLLEMGVKTNVSIRIVPFSAGVHGGMAACGPFTLLDFPAGADGDPLEPPLAYAETLTGAMYLQKPDEVNAYRLAWSDLEKRALNQKASMRMISEAQKGYTRG
ncbi:Transcriptional regulator, contains XRE-family HTH domain [Micromonospora nigra]|uniref:Transcriptional regulator, contains XRE-family HTH domain n=1 Tax=Micromonospora nigra TaxID=145857 RepID=A0A1C6R814_9ACTN|nr:helix-turn-helix transcriptional regulator [Micromonospora nigra]SCL13031.1 Transcriptional regulator, contains XRE-family HTH domain [Micromonospora nigra]